MRVSIRILLALAFLPSFVAIMRLERSKLRAIRILSVAGLIGLILASLIFPNIWDFAASLIGINSGVDLLLYVTVLTVITQIAVMLNKFREIEKKLTRIVRAISIMETRNDRP